MTEGHIYAAFAILIAFGVAIHSADTITDYYTGFITKEKAMSSFAVMALLVVLLVGYATTAL
jgi:hypothetical protein